jgi:hypothetical protein
MAWGERNMKSSVIAAIGGLALHAVALWSPARAEVAAFSTPAPVIEKITQCLQDGLEAFMTAQGPECVKRNTGNKTARATGMPFGVENPAVVCDNEENPDQRRLSGDTVIRVLQLATKLARPIAPSGIRIVGAIFCGELDLTGLDLPYSLILDNSAFAGLVMVRNVKIRGDLSFDESFLASSLIIARTRIDGSFYAETGFIRRLIVSDSYIQGSWHQTSSIVLGNTAFYGMTLSGDAYFSGSALSMLTMATSTIHGGLDLTNTESRCGYHVRSSEIGIVFAERFGFGALAAASQISPDPQHDGTAVYLPWWSRMTSRAQDRPGSVGARMASPAVHRLIAAEIDRVREVASRPKTAERLPGCENLTGSQSAEFHFLNNRIQTNLCLRTFSWLERRDAPAFPTTVLSLNGTRISGNLIVDLWGREQEARNAPPNPGTTANDIPGIPRETRKFEAIGVSMSALIFDFKDNAQDYVTYIDGFTFNQVHTASVNCAFQRVSEGGITQADFSTRGGVIEQPSLPSVQDVLDWLKKNDARSSQPFTAFVAAFEHVGADSSELRIARKTLDLCEKSSWRNAISCPKPVRPKKQDLTSPRSDASAAVAMMETASDFVSNLGQWGLFYLADHGIRPTKVLWPLVVVLAFYFLVFRVWLGIVAFEPKESKDKNSDHPPAIPRPRYLGTLFLFDRLMPIYKIKDEHYTVGRYFRMATGGEIGAACDPAKPPYQMRRLWMRPWVYPVNDDEKDRIESWLVWLRVIGAVLAVFLLAAINALTRG